MRNQAFNADCFDVFPLIPDGSIDMILCDLPYGTTACKWDTILPFDKLWQAYERIIKPNGAIVLTASQPFTTELINSNRLIYKYSWYWAKNTATGISLSKYQPMRCIEEIIIFCKGKLMYNKQPTKHRTKDFRKNIKRSRKGKSNHYFFDLENSESLAKEFVNPVNLLFFDSVPQCHRKHPTQKPVALFEYLIKTYTNEGDLVLDNCAGSFTTAIAAINTNRNYICIEKEPEYYQKGIERIKNHTDL